MLLAFRRVLFRSGNDAQFDSTVALLPSLDLNEANFINLNSNIVTRVLKMEDITNIISNDTKKSFYQETGFDEVILGNLKYTGRFNNLKSKLDLNNSILKFDVNKYPFLKPSSNVCLEETKNEIQYVITPSGTIETNATCKTIPVIIMPKSNLIQVMAN